MVFTAITQGIKVSVTSEYQAEYSNPLKAHYVFTYRIVIENQSDFTIQLRRRRWFIFDSCGTTTEIEGQGVIGQEPVLAPGQSHQYVSGCHLQSDIGKMKGTYVMERLIDRSEFSVMIPSFTMVVPYRLN
jgi:ApaG protein